jgi:hypothetical protein
MVVYIICYSRQLKILTACYNNYLYGRVKDIMKNRVLQGNHFGVEVVGKNRVIKLFRFMRVTFVLTQNPCGNLLKDVNY